MGVSGEKFQSHVEFWSKKLRNYRKHWPKRLFRHEPIENAVKILQEGQILSRKDAKNKIVSDIAPTGIINTNSHAHSSVRLYFRPRNPTQYHIEGIKKQNEYYYGKHGGVIVIFVFKASNILTKSDTRFSDGNMQSDQSKVFQDNQGFDQLDFSKVYHDSPQNDPEIIRARCAEVLSSSPLQMTEDLEYILVKSNADRITLSNLLDAETRLLFSDKIKVAAKTGFFFSLYTGVEYVDIIEEKIKVKLSDRKDGRLVKTQFSILDPDSRRVEKQTTVWDAETKRPWVWAHGQNTGRHILRITLEGILAYEAPFNVS